MLGAVIVEDMRLLGTKPARIMEHASPGYMRADSTRAVGQRDEIAARTTHALLLEYHNNVGR